MRHLAVFLLAATGIFAADFATGQAARAVLGQQTFTKQSPESNTVDGVLGAAGAVAYANGVLVIGDSNRLGASPANPRVIIHRNFDSVLLPPTAVFSNNTDIRCPVCLMPAGLSVGQRETVNDKPAWTIGLKNNAFRLPTAVATDGTRLVVADTDSNRVLIWNTLPTSQTQPADVVLGQPDFTSDCPNAIGPRNPDSSCPGSASSPTARSLRGPQGVWIQGNKLFVADDQNHRVLIWDPIPAENFAPAQVVLGQPNFTTRIEPDLTKREFNVKADTLLNPVSVTSDGTRLFVSDLGHNRVLIWNTIPTANAQPADVVVGQPDMTSALANNSSKLCASNGTDSSGNPTYPRRCAATLDFPRFALSDGNRLFIADGGNDRVLVFNTIPSRNGAAANAILGQIGEIFAQSSDNPDNPDVNRRGAADALRTPTSLAWDGTNLYVAEPFSRRIMIFSPSDIALPLTGIRNAASLDVFAVGAVTFGGTVTENNEITLTIRDKEYKYKLKKDDTIATIINQFVSLINAGEGDPWVIATPNPSINAVILTSRIGGPEGNNTTLSAKVVPTTTATITASTSSSLNGGQDAAKLGPGTLISIFGPNLADLQEGEIVPAPAGSDPLPFELAGVQVYVDGMRAPILSVTRNQINAMLPYEVQDATSVTAWVRKTDKSGRVIATTALGIPVVPANPGIFTFPGAEPRAAVALHGSSSAVGTVSVDGTPKAGEKVSVTIAENRTYSYTLADNDTLETVRDKLIEQINASDPEVRAFPAGQFTRIRLRARTPGAAGNGIKYTAKSEGTNVVMTATTGALCCANVEGALITDQNPAVPGENIVLYATGLGLVSPDEALYALYSGFTYKGPEMNKAVVRMDALAGGKTANVLFMGALRGTVGLYRVDLELLSDLPTNPKTQVTIAQEAFVSNIATIPVVNPNASSTTTP